MTKKNGCRDADNKDVQTWCQEIEFDDGGFSLKTYMKKEIEFRFNFSNLVDFGFLGWFGGIMSLVSGLERFLWCLSHTHT
jgi:hypothetical protein